MSDDRLIVALDVPNVVQGLDLVNRIGDAASFYKIGLGMLTQVVRALAPEGKRVVLVAPSAAVAGVVRTSRLDAVMPIAESLDAARALIA
jgi:anti-anti-sigma regulatory factor